MTLQHEIEAVVNKMVGKLDKVIAQQQEKMKKAKSSDQAHYQETIDRLKVAKEELSNYSDNPKYSMVTYFDTAIRAIANALRAEVESSNRQNPQSKRVFSLFKFNAHKNTPQKCLQEAEDTAKAIRAYVSDRIRKSCGTRDIEYSELKQLGRIEETLYSAQTIADQFQLNLDKQNKALQKIKSKIEHRQSASKPVSENDLKFKKILEARVARLEKVKVGFEEFLQIRQGIAQLSSSLQGTWLQRAQQAATKLEALIDSTIKEEMGARKNAPDMRTTFNIQEGGTTVLGLKNTLRRVSHLRGEFAEAEKQLQPKARATRATR